MDSFLTGFVSGLVQFVCWLTGFLVDRSKDVALKGIEASAASGHKRKMANPAIKQTQDENQRIAECREVVLHYANHLGYIARECMSRKELAKKIDSGATASELTRILNYRIAKTPGIILGEHGAQRFPVKLPYSWRTRHTYICGKSGSGKTNFIRGMVMQDIAEGNGVGILAPEQELLTDEILPYIPDDRIDDVIYVNPADTEYPIPLNPLHLEKGANVDLAVDDLLTIFKRLVGETGARMDEILRQSFYALLEREGSTLLDVEPLLRREDSRLRDEIIHTSEDEQTVTFFRDIYPSYPKDAHLPITTRISRLIRPKAVRNLLCQPGQSLSFRDAMDEGKILLFNLSDGILGEQTSQLLGQLVVSKIQIAVMSRADTAKSARRPFYLYLDEFQAFVGVNAAAYQRLFSRSRKYGFGFTLAHQQTGQIPNDLLREILGNVSTIIAFNVSRDDANKFSKEMVFTHGVDSEAIPPEWFLRLKIGEAWAKIDKTVFPLKTKLADQNPNFVRAKEVIEQSRQNYGIHVSQKANKPYKALPDVRPDVRFDDEIDPGQVF